MQIDLSKFCSITEKYILSFLSKRCLLGLKQKGTAKDILRKSVYEVFLPDVLPLKWTQSGHSLQPVHSLSYGIGGQKPDIPGYTYFTFFFLHSEKEQKPK